MTEITLLIESMVYNIDRFAVGKYDSATGRTYVCNTKWARVGKIVKDGSFRSYKITEISYNNWIKAVAVLPTNLDPLNGNLIYQAPSYFNGTKIATNKEFVMSGATLPLVWLLEIISTTNYGRGDSREYEANLRMFFLDETDVVNYYTRDHRIQVVQPMSALAEGFLETVNSTKGVARVEKYDVVSFSRFGVEKQEGVFQNILDANLSGVEVRFNLVKYKENCKINC
jgi:hypothetical protein